jgi:triacylglycerol lipase
MSHVYLSPGLFGFQSVGSYDYFGHVDQAIRRRFAQAGKQVEVHVVNVHPTASIRRRAALLGKTIDATAGETGAIHLIGHSTGGLDARLLATPTLQTGQARPAWRDRVRSISSMSVPHYGTPLASFFATVSGQRLLYAVSALTVAALKLGAPPLAISASLVAAIGTLDQAVGLDLGLVEQLTDRVVRVLDNASSTDLQAYLKLLRDDQGAIIQLSPESMDLFQASVEDDPAVYYQCTLSYAPAPGVAHWARSLMSPWANLSAPIYATLHRLTALQHDNYPCTPQTAESEDILLEAFGHVPPPAANDGVVPVRSQIWGKVVWAGLGDHLDVVGHFRGEPEAPEHVDWMSSGSGYDRRRFNMMLDAIVKGMLSVDSE